MESREIIQYLDVRSLNLAKKTPKTARTYQIIYEIFLVALIINQPYKSHHGHTQCRTNSIDAKNNTKQFKNTTWVELNNI